MSKRQTASDDAACEIAKINLLQAKGIAMRLRIADDKSAYWRLQGEEGEALPLFLCLKELLRYPERTV